MAYCATADLVLGDIPLPGYINTSERVNDAADEIDSRIGYIYQTPINIEQGSPVERPARLLLKRINSHLASGRILLAIAAPSEQTSLHAYGWSLVKESLDALEQIKDGDIVLEGAPTAENAVQPAATVPLISNLDPESSVEAFYNRIANPDYSYGYSRINRPGPDGFVL